MGTTPLALTASKRFASMSPVTKLLLMLMSRLLAGAFMSLIPQAHNSLFAMPFSLIVNNISLNAPLVVLKASPSPFLLCTLKRMSMLLVLFVYYPLAYAFFLCWNILFVPLSRNPTPKLLAFMRATLNVKLIGLPLPLSYRLFPTSSLLSSSMDILTLIILPPYLILNPTSCNSLISMIPSIFLSYKTILGILIPIYTNRER